MCKSNACELFRLTRKVHFIRALFSTMNPGEASDLSMWDACVLLLLSIAIAFQ